MLDDKTRVDLIRHALARASEGAEHGFSFYAGADRLVALRYYAGVCGYPRSDGTGPDNQRERITRRFMALARQAGLTCTEVRDYLAVDIGGGQVAYGLYGA